MAERVGFEPTCRFWRQDAFEAPPLRPLRYLSAPDSLTNAQKDLPLPPGCKETLNQAGAFLRENARHDHEAMVEPGKFVRTAGGLNRARFRLGCAVHECADTGVNHRADAHQTRFDRHVE